MILVSRQFALAMVIYATAISGAPIKDDLDSIFLRLYVGTTMDEYIDYSLENVNDIQSKIISNRSTAMYIHGLWEHLQKESVQLVVGAYLKRNDHNIIAVDYSKLANNSYIKVVQNAPYIASAVAKALEEMVRSGFNPEKLHIVGHSMGAQIAGYIGREVKSSFEVPRITGLDPAGPLFNIIEDRLSASDARFVDIIHTDWGFYGVSRITGTVNFFPNGGRRIQPGCPLKYRILSDEDFCSHHRSWRFWSESLINESAFLGVQCSLLSHFNSGECNNNPRFIMGYGTPNDAKGSVYLVTNTKSPYGMYEKGSRSVP